LLALVAPTSASSSEPEGVEPQPEELAQSWLLGDCDLGVADVQERMRKQADAVAELLLVAFRKGPSDALAAKTEQEARARFALRRKVLTEPDVLGLSPIDLARVANVSEADHVARVLDSLRLRYRTQALRGLLQVRPDLALPVLAREANDRESPLREVAVQLLESHP
jgi:hypothetical protein